ncbi:MAG: hypothetical protein DDT40_01725 [candidate division WS2 bacterium]|nr:hypothetical protein [Candidatus Psychracetigena formicireducens]
MKENRLLLIITGGVIGLMAILLVKLGNPHNMGLCVACFYRDIVGALGLHRTATVQYLRPEIIGLILGSFIMATAKREFRPRGGSSPIIRFVLGFLMMTGAMVFLGCPLRMLLRLGNGDLNALIGLFGFVGGIWLGIQFLKNGYSLGKSSTQPLINGYFMSAFAVILLVLLIASPTFIFFTETRGPGFFRAPLILSLVAGLIIGALAQRTRLCTAGDIRNTIIIKDPTFLLRPFGILLFTLIGSLILNPTSFELGFLNQPFAHSDHIWNFLGMLLLGLTSVLLGGCPLRQTIMAAEGDGDSVFTIISMMLGAAFSHNFGFAASTAYVPLYGKIAVVAGLLLVILLGWHIIKYEKVKG